MDGAVRKAEDVLNQAMSEQIEACQARHDARTADARADIHRLVNKFSLAADKKVMRLHDRRTWFSNFVMTFSGS